MGLFTKKISISLRNRNVVYSIPCKSIYIYIVGVFSIDRMPHSKFRVNSVHWSYFSTANINRF